MCVQNSLRAGALAVVLAHTTAAVFVVNLQAPSFIADDKFLSFSYDASQVKGSDNFGFFTSARVDAIVGGLSPAYFRFSGTDIDYMLFDENGQCDNKYESSEGFSGCLNATQVIGLLNLTARTNTSLVFGVNGYIGKSSTVAPNAPWNRATLRLSLAGCRAPWPRTRSSERRLRTSLATSRTCGQRGRRARSWHRTWPRSGACCLTPCPERCTPLRAGPLRVLQR